MTPRHEKPGLPGKRTLTDLFSDYRAELKLKRGQGFGEGLTVGVLLQRFGTQPLSLLLIVNKLQSVTPENQRPLKAPPHTFPGRRPILFVTEHC